MALITFPSDIHLLDVSMSPWFPSQEVVVRDYSDRVDVYNNAPGGWRGRLVVTGRGGSREQIRLRARKLYQWISDMAVAGNTSRIILPPTFQGRTPNVAEPNVSATFALAGGVLTATTSVNLATTYGALPGDWVTFGRLFNIVSINGTAVVLDPPVRPRSGWNFAINKPTVEIRLSEVPAQGYSGMYPDSVTIDWIEAS